MPFTPFHLGPAILIGVALRRRIDIFATLVGSVVLDLEPFIILSCGFSSPIHGLFHTYLAAVLLTLPLATILYCTRDASRPLLSLFGLYQQSSFTSVVVSTMVGLFSHVFLDSLLYAEMVPLYPIPGNAMLGLVSYGAVYMFCIISGMLGLSLHILTSVLHKCSPSQSNTAPDLLT